LKQGLILRLVACVDWEQGHGAEKLCSGGVNICPVNVCAFFCDVTVPARNIVSVFDFDLVITKIGILPEELYGFLEAFGETWVSLSLENLMTQCQN
jgi:hypothetical protein